MSQVFVQLSSRIGCVAHVLFIPGRVPLEFRLSKSETVDYLGDCMPSRIVRSTRRTSKDGPPLRRSERVRDVKNKTIAG